MVAAGCAVGGGSAVFGAADAIEGAQDIYYGSMGDIDSTAVNQLKEKVFQGNEEAYDSAEDVFAFLASAFVPIGKASGVGNLSFRSGSIAAAKEGISALAGEGASHMATELMGNRTAGMIAGMLASGTTAHGLNQADMRLHVSGNNGGSGSINGLKIIDSKVDGKIPLKEYEKIREMSIHNPDSDSMILGKYFDGTIESGSYVAKAEATGDTYFSLGTKWDDLENTYGLTDKDMFELFNKTALDNAVLKGKTIRFVQDPRKWSGTALGDEWNYLQSKHKYTDLIEEGGYWYAIK